MSTALNINNLLGDKLFQVIGSTPASIADSLKKVNIRGDKDVGAQLFAASIFASAVNKATLETFLADQRFSAIRPVINAALAIQGKSNMTAITLLGHCFLTTDLASEVVFAAEFRKKMGQSNLWAGELESGSLSDMQKKILKEKKRVTNEAEAKALGSGFLKFTGLIPGNLTGKELDFFGTGTSASASAGQASSGSSMSAAQPQNNTSIRSPPATSALPPVSRARADTTLRSRRVSPPDATADVERFRTSSDGDVDIPANVMSYRRNVIGSTDEDIDDSIKRRGLAGFISATSQMMRDDPDGTKLRAASVAAGR